VRTRGTAVAAETPPGSISVSTEATFLVPALVVTLVIYLFPLLLLGRYSFNAFKPGEFMVTALTLENYVNVIVDPYYRAVLATTISMALAVTILSLVLGIPLAHFISRSVRYKKALILLVIIPLFVGNAVRAAGWMLALGEQGLVNATLIRLHLVGSPLSIMFTPAAVLIGSISVNIPFVVLTIQSVLEGVGASVEEAASSLGATPFEVFRKVTWPLALAGIRTATVISFILSMNAYATPVLLGGPGFQMMAPDLTDEILAKNNWPLGATLAFVLIATTLGLTWGFGRLRLRARP
jgi:putative spermidine/putrescine transport system permease protein